jgi:chromosome partitioning protein
MAPRILSFIGAKGGTLKTASVAAVAHVIAKAGLRVAMVDGDPQADLTSRSGFSRVADPLAADPVRVQYEGEPPLDLWLLRSGRSLEGADLDAFRRHLLRAAGLDVDLVVVDTPPALGPITTATLRASDLIIIPAMPGKESLERANDVITLARQQPDPPPIRILVTLAHLQSNLFRWMQEQLDDLYPEARIASVVPYEMPAGEAALFEVPVTVSSPRSRSSATYCDVAAEVLVRLDLADGSPRAARGVA